jgi:hypothetical protein
MVKYDKNVVLVFIRSNKLTHVAILLIKIAISIKSKLLHFILLGAILGI